MKYVIFIMAMLTTAILALYLGLALPTVVALLVLLCAVTADFYTTWRCLKERGREGNPVVAFLFKRVGVLKTFGLMAILWTVFISFRWIHQTEGIQTAVAVAYWLVPVNNMVVLARLKRQNVRC